MNARILHAVALAAALAGCETVERARNAQREAAPDCTTNAAEIAASRMGAEPPAFVFSGNVSPDEYVRFALDNRPDVASAALAAESARIAARAAGAGRWPQISARGGYSRSTSNRTTGGDWRTEGSPSAAVDLDLLIYDFGKLSAQEQAAVENLVAAEEALADTELAAACEVRTALFSWLEAEALLAAAETNEVLYAEHLRTARDRFEVGEVRKLDVTQARLNHSNAQLAMIRASNAVCTASSDLMHAIGVSAAVVPASSGAGLREPAFRLPRTELSAAEAVDFARTNAPSLMAARARVRAAFSRVDSAVADLYPSISLGTAFNFTNPDFPAVWNWSWAANIAGTIFSGGRRRAAIDAAAAELFSARAALAEAEQRLAAQIAVAVAERDTARRALATSRVIVRQARENLELVTEQYRVGEASSIDLLSAVAEHTTALGDRVKAFYGEQAAEARLARLAGLSPAAEPAPPAQSGADTGNKEDGDV